MHRGCFAQNYVRTFKTLEVIDVQIKKKNNKTIKFKEVTDIPSWEETHSCTWQQTGEPRTRQLSHFSMLPSRK